MVCGEILSRMFDVSSTAFGSTYAVSMYAVCRGPDVVGAVPLRRSLGSPCPRYLGTSLDS